MQKYYSANGIELSQPCYYNARTFLPKCIPLDWLHIAYLRHRQQPPTHFFSFFSLPLLAHDEAAERSAGMHFARKMNIYPFPSAFLKYPSLNWTRPGRTQLNSNFPFPPPTLPTLDETMKQWRRSNVPHAYNFNCLC